MTQHNRIYTSMAAFQAERPQLPYPCVCKITDGTDLFVFFRHDAASKPDTLYTVGKSRFHLDYSVINGEALLV